MTKEKTSHGTVARSTGPDREAGVRLGVEFTGVTKQKALPGGMTCRGRPHPVDSEDRLGG